MLSSSRSSFFALLLIFLVHSTIVQAVPASLRFAPGEGCGRCRLRLYRSVSVANTSRYGEHDAVNAPFVQKGQCLQIPFKVIHRFVSDPSTWCTWNGNFGAVRNTQLKKGSTLRGQLNIQPEVKWPKGAQASPTVIKHTNVTTYFTEYGWTQSYDQDKNVLAHTRAGLAYGKLSDTHTCMETFSRSTGPILNTYSQQFMDAATCGSKATLDGAKCLEYAFFVEGRLDARVVKKHCHAFTGNGCDAKARDIVSCLQRTFSLRSLHAQKK